MRLIFILFSFINCVSFIYSQDKPTSQLRIVRYVTSKEGLNVRDKPSRTGDKMGTLLYGTRVIITSRSENQETIGGINEYWYGLPPSPEWRHGIGWVFGGYLSATMPEDTPVVLGEWRIEGQDKLYYWDFRPDGYMVHGNPVSGGGLIYGGSQFIGNWILQGNKLTIEARGFQTQWGVGNNRRETIEIIVTIINRDKIILRFKDGSEHVLIRSNDPL